MSDPLLWLVWFLSAVVLGCTVGVRNMIAGALLIVGGITIGRIVMVT